MQKRLGPLCVLVAGTLWGVMGVFGRHFNEQGLGALEIGWIRVFFGLLAVSIYLAVFHPDAFKVRFKDLWCFVGTGIVSLFMMNLTYYSAIAYTSLSVASVLLYTAPIFVMLMSAVIFREKITIKKIIALVLAFSGCVLVSGVGTDTQVSLLGFLCGLGAGISYSLYSIFGRYAIQRGYRSWTMIFYTFLFALIMHSLTCDWSLIGKTVTDLNEIPWAVGLGLIANFLPYLFYSLGLESMESGRASVLASIEPVVATIVGIFFFHELPTLLAWSGIVLVLIAIAMLSLQKGEQE